MPGEGRRRQRHKWPVRQVDKRAGREEWWGGVVGEADLKLRGISMRKENNVAQMRMPVRKNGIVGSPSAHRPDWRGLNRSCK